MASNSGAGPQTPIIVQTQGSSETPNWRAYGKKREYGRLAATRRRRIKETILENPLQIFVYLFKIVIFLSFVCLMPLFSQTTYYVSSSQGNDNNTGTSEITP